MRIFVKILFTLVLAIFYCSAMAAIVVGNPHGKVTLVEFFDYQCPHCRRMVKAVDRLIKKNSNLRVVYRAIPAFGFMSQYDARAAIAAYQQGSKKYICFRDLLLTNSASKPSAVMFLASKAGLDIKKLVLAIRKKKISRFLQANISDFESKDLTSVPGFIVKKSNSNIIRFQYSGELPGLVLQNEITKVMRDKDV